MVRLLKSFKTEIHPTNEQKSIINRTIGTCRYVYNFYIARNIELYHLGKKFVTGKDFSIWLNNEFIPNNQEYSWIKSVSSKSVKRSIENGYTAFCNFFRGNSHFPRFKKKGKSSVKMYFVKNNPSDCLCERHRIKIPTLGWVKLKEKGYIPTSKNGYVIRSGAISIRAGRYYVSVIVDVPCNDISGEYTEGIGVDLGVKNFAIVSNGMVFKNINKTNKVRKLERKLRREQRRLSKKYENKRFKKGGATGGEQNSPGKNIDKQRLKVQKLYQRLDNIRTDYVNKVVVRIAKTKPSYVTIEDLNVSGIMRNRHLARAIASEKLYEFRRKLTEKDKLFGIETRVVSRFYPSSKLCHACGRRNTSLRLSDRVFKCECGYVEDRDFNASLNLRDARDYSIA